MGYMSACAVFLVFNVISGRFFLGDMGSYGLGAAIVLYSLWFVAEGVSRRLSSPAFWPIPVLTC